MTDLLDKIDGSLKALHDSDTSELLRLAKRTITALQVKLAAREATPDRFRSALDTMRAERDSVVAERNRSWAERDDLQKRYETLEADRVKVAKDAAATQGRCNDLLTLRNNLVAECETARKKEADLQATVNRLRAERDSLLKTVEGMDSVKQLIDQDCRECDKKQVEIATERASRREAQRSSDAWFDTAKHFEAKRDGLQSIVDQLPTNADGDVVFLGGTQERISGGFNPTGLVTSLQEDECYVQTGSECGWGWIPYDQLKTPRQMAEEDNSSE